MDQATLLTARLDAAAREQERLSTLLIAMELSATSAMQELRAAGWREGEALFAIITRLDRLKSTLAEVALD